MATVVFGAIGAGIGSVFGQWTLGWSIGTVVGGLLFPPNTGSSGSNKLSDLRISGSSYGTAIPRLWGPDRIGGNTLWSTDLVEHKQSGGGGSGLGTSSQTSYTYSVSCAIMICQGPIIGLKRIWFQNEVIWDADSPTTSSINNNIVIYLGTETQGVDPTVFANVTTLNGKFCTAYRGIAYIVFNNIDLSKYGNSMPNVGFEVQATAVGALTIQQVLTDVCTDAGINPADCDFTAGTQLITSYIRPTRQTARQTIDPLLQVYPGDLVEVEGKLKYIVRGGTAVYTIPQGDLGTVFWTDGGAEEFNAPIDFTRGQELDIPTSVDVLYYTYSVTKALRTYQQGSQNMTRVTKNYLVNPQTINVPMSITDVEAKQMAARMLYTYWNERQKTIISLPMNYIDLIPSDIINIPISGSTMRCRVIDIEAAPIGPLHVSLVKDDSATNTQTQVTPGQTGGTGGNRYIETGILTYWAWNGNALLDSHIGGSLDLPGIYLACSWPSGDVGCTVYISRDAGLSFQLLTSIFSYSPIGIANNTLGTFTDTAIFDNTNTIDVTLARGTPTSVGYWDTLAGVNAVLVGKEVILFMTATLIDGPTNRWRLSALLRGQRGTDTYMATHAASEKVVILSNNAIRQTLDMTYLNKSITLRFVPTGGSLASTSDFIFTVTGAELLPYSVIDITGIRDGSNNLTISWIRRARKGGSWSDLTDVSLVDIPENYDVEIWNSTYTVLKRTFTAVTSPTQIYTSANQVTDFGSNQNPVYVKIYQNNTLIGRGYVKLGSI